MTQVAPSAVAGVDGTRGAEPSRRRLDAVMRRLLRISEVRPEAARSAHRAMRISLLVTAIRCSVIYVVIPIAVPLVSFARVVATPISIALCLFALVNGVLGVRRFWVADHRSKWAYTGFMLVVFAVLVVALVLDITKLVTA